MVRKPLLVAALCLAPLAARAQTADAAADSAVRAACGNCIVGLAMPSLGDQSTWTLSFAPDTTATQQSEAWSAFKADTGAQWQAQAQTQTQVRIQSTSNPALDGAYTITHDQQAIIDGIYAGIKNGDGVPGGGTTFNYPDSSGVMHAFDAASFPNFAKAIRDYLYQLSQGASPSQPVAIP
jgi:hypothetical protein